MKPNVEFPMKILALEFSSPQRSVAVIRRDGPHASSLVSEIIDSGTNSPLAMIDDALREAALEREQIDCIAVGIGPGSYTGIRIAISLAQGWQLARAVKILGISSAETIAAQAKIDGLTGTTDVLIDAQRDEFYVATYDLTADLVRQIEPLKIITAAETRQLAESARTLIGPEISRSFPRAKTIFPRAATLGTIALARTDFIPGEKLEPIYLRETKFVKAPPPRNYS